MARPAAGDRRAAADPLGDRDVDVLEDREPAEQAVDLKRASDTELHPLR